MKTMIGLLGMLLLASACSNADTSADEAAAATTEQALEAAAVTTAGSATTAQICQLFMQRQRSCSSTFIPALVDARVKSDQPAGIAAIDADKGREALVKQALDEWASDSRDPAIEATCRQIAEAVAPARDAELRTSVNACLAIADCDAFVPCAVPVSLKRWKE